MYGRSAERERWSERGDCEAAGRQSHGGADAPRGGAVRSEEEVAF